MSGFDLAVAYYKKGGNISNENHKDVAVVGLRNKDVG